MKNAVHFFGLLALSALVSCGSKDEKGAALDTVPAITKPSQIVCIGRVEPENKIVKLASEVSGIIQKINFQAGDSIRKGQVIIELSHSVEDAQVRYNVAQYATRTADLSTLQASLESAMIKAENAKVKMDRIKASSDKGADTKQNADNASTEYQTAVKEVDRLQAAIRTAQVQLNEISTQKLVNQSQVDRKLIRAPYDGVLLTMELAVGSPVQALVAVGDFAPAGYKSVLAEVDELFADQIKLGSKVQIRLQGQTEVVANGTIISAAPFLKRKSLFSEGGDMEDRRVREIRVRLSDGSLLFGSRVECVIEN